MKQEIKEYTTHRLVKGEDLNHHGTLFAGRGAEWFVESGFIAASHMLSPKNLICAKVDSLNFKEPVRPGECVCFTSKIVFVGRTSIMAYIRVSKSSCERTLVDGFAVFVHVDENTKPIPHGIELETIDKEDIKLMKWAKHVKETAYTFEDMEWAFEEGVHEGGLREYYKKVEYGNDVFSESDLKYYIKNKKE